MGATDSLISFLGAGINRAAIALNASGTTDVIAVSLSEPPRSEVGYPVEHILEDLWLLSLSPVRGPTLAWFKQTLLPSGSTYADMDRLASQAPPGADGLVCLPYFSGEKGLVHNPLARGALVGLDLHHGPSDIARAGLEGIALSLRQIFGAYQDQGVSWDEIRLCGGGAGSEFWNQIKADVLGRELSVMEVLETGCLGAAMVASVAVGLQPDLESASSELSRVSKIVEPNLGLQELYEDAYQAFRRLYPAIAPSLDQLDVLKTTGNSGAD
jgi:xylulokinase